MEQEVFPIDLSKLKALKLDPSVTSLSDETKANLRHNIQLCRDAIVFFTALAGAKGGWRVTPAAPTTPSRRS